jgi:pimeloyl-ACP methyl ester carboxylesterase
MSSIATAYGLDSRKPALVLIHGLGSAGTIWKTLIPELILDFSVYVIDLPGHGDAPLKGDINLDPKSLAKDIVEILERDHGVTEMHVAGNSLGGWIALEMANVAPRRVKSVTGLAPAGLWLEGPISKLPPSMDARILAKISQFFMPIAYHLPPLKALGYRKITHLWRELSYESCRDSVIAMARSTGFMPLWRAVRHQKFVSEIPSDVDVTIVFGDHDIMIPKNIAQDRSVAPAHAKWIEVENCAHVIMWNFPGLTVDFIRRTAGVFKV